MKSRKFYLFIILFASVAVFFGCTKDVENADDGEQLITIQNGQQMKISSLRPGTMRIKVSEEFANKLESITDEEGIISNNVKSADDIISEMGVTRMERTFPYAGKFEKRTRESGLHLWYDIFFDEETSLTKAGGDLSSVKGIELIEYRPKLVKLWDEKVELVNPSTNTVTQNSELPFDDPQLPNQWHYYNDGSRTGSVSGCDINVVPAWNKFLPGNESVIVSIVDGGVDYSHEDLSANMWHNPEQSGDLQYGYNFVTKGYRIVPEDHGTHVAGTVSAVNNNGIGVCGVAGGNYSLGIPGVKLMSCQIFQGEGQGDGAQAIKWSADHGAVISQNSWGYKENATLSSSDKAAINYFISNAGYDENKNQTGPMAGGLVVFSAGNDELVLEDDGHGNALVVTSVGADYKKAYYSNYGKEQYELVAPGGDVKKGFQILSTLPGNQYGKMQGTSMACPHVSGVAALIVANRGTVGFTRDALLERLIKYSNPITKEYNPNYELGSGLVNAYASIIASSGNPPEKVKKYEVAPISNSIQFTITIPNDKDDGIPSGLTAYFSKNTFKNTVGISSKSFQIPDSKNAGDTINCTVPDLDFETLYYVAVDAFDMAGNKSELSDKKQVATLANNPPKITADSGLVATVRAFQTKYMMFTIDEPDGHKFTYDLIPGSDAVSSTLIAANKIQLTITGKNTLPGRYQAKLTVTDQYGLSSHADISYTILENTPPRKLKDIDNILFGGKSETTIEIPLDEYFTDDDGETLTFISESTNPSVANLNYNKGILYITPMAFGNTDVTVTAKDVKEKSVSSSFKILVRDKAQEIDLYPNPVKDILKIRTSEEASASVTLYSGSGATVFSSDISISPFNPAEIDMSGMSGGTYTIIVNYSGKEIKRNIVKL